MERTPAARLLALIAGDDTAGYFDVRVVFTGDRGVAQEFFRLTRLDSAADYIGRMRRHGDVYVGAAPRPERAGGADAVARAWCLWVDCDTPAATAALAQFRCPPTLTVASGSGDNVHGWWALTAPVPADWIARANRRLAAEVGADVRCVERARILRVPGTLNHKHDPPAPVLIQGDCQARHSLTDLVADLPVPQAPAPKRAPQARRRDVGPDPLLTISASEYVPALTGREANARGKVACPLHGGGDERTPSLMAYRDPARGWYCYGCGQGGRIYDFAGLLWGMPTSGPGFLELRARLTRELRV